MVGAALGSPLISAAAALAPLMLLSFADYPDSFFKALYFGLEVFPTLFIFSRLIFPNEFAPGNELIEERNAIKACLFLFVSGIPNIKLSLVCLALKFITVKFKNIGA